MSYINMDHAGWVQRNIAVTKPNATKSEKRKAAEHSKGWAAAPDELNEFQKRAIDILGIIGGGIYNAPIAWDSVYWKPKTIACSWYKGFGPLIFRNSPVSFSCAMRRGFAAISHRWRPDTSRSH